MRCRWLGWAGLEVQEGDARILIDPLAEPGGVYAAAGDAAAGAVMPELADPAAGPPAAAAFVTHLHRDHTDAGALSQALAPGAPVYAPASYPGTDPLVDAGTAQARAELAAAGIEPVETPAWERVEVGPFTVTALPAADGTGEPPVSWAVEADGRRIVHCGDTAFHGWWWRAAWYAGPFDAAFLPVNGAVVDFPWRRPASPLPAAMTAEQAAVAAAALGARMAVPIHFGGFDLEPFYRSDADALDRFVAAGPGHGVDVLRLEVGGALDVDELEGATRAIA